MTNLPRNVQQLLNELVGDHPRTYTSWGREVTYTETGLIQQLEDSLESTITPGGGPGGGTAPGGTVNLGSVVLQENITSQIASLSRAYGPNPNGFTFYGAVVATRIPLAERVNLFVNGWWKPENEDWLLQFLQETVTDIRNHLDPPKPPLPLRGAPCPQCHEREVIVIDECWEGNGTYRNPALFYDYTDQLVHCLACQHSYDLRDKA